MESAVDRHVFYISDGTAITAEVLGHAVNFEDLMGVSTVGDLLAAVDAELASGEQRLREMERYVTSDTFTLRSRFRQL